VFRDQMIDRREIGTGQIAVEYQKLRDLLVGGLDVERTARQLQLEVKT
jgi:hypothetical protein